MPPYGVDFELGGKDTLEQWELMREIFNFWLYGSSTIINVDL